MHARSCAGVSQKTMTLDLVSEGEVETMNVAPELSGFLPLPRY